MGSHITLGNLTIDRDRFEVLIDGRRIDLTFVEFELLDQLARNAGKVVARSRLLQTVWRGRTGTLGADRTLTVHMSRMRKKLRDSKPWQIETTTKRGYALNNRNQSHHHGGPRRLPAMPMATEAQPMEP